jgi:hypothetical protein
LAFFLAIPSSTLASVSSGMASRPSITQVKPEPQPSRKTERYEGREMAASKWQGLNDWTTGKMTVAQAFGVSKGTVKYPKLTAQLPATQAEVNTKYKGLPKQDYVPASSATTKSNQELGQKMAAEQPYNWTGQQWIDLNNVVMAESGWDATIENPTSGAYGIPQALPGSKMASAGPNWETNAATQIKWMLGYIQSTYGTPSVAWAHEEAYGWY